MFKKINSALFSNFNTFLSYKKCLSAFLLAILVIGTVPLFFSVGNIIAPKDPLIAKAAGGVLDTAFTANTGVGFQNSFIGIVHALKVQIDGKIVAGGFYSAFNGTTTNRIARLNADGTLDTTFTTNTGTGFDNGVRALAIQPDGKIIAGGEFTTFNGTTTNHIARLNADGTLDTTFATNIGTGFDNAIYALTLQPDGKIIVGGYFSTFNGTINTNSIARLNSNGTLDTTFTTNTGTGFGGGVLTLVVQPDGKIIAGGYFNTFNTTSTNYIVRLNADGTHDSIFTFNDGTGFDSGVYAIALQPDGKIVLGGYFCTFNGTITTNRIARLNADGTLDTTFTFNNHDSFNTYVSSLALQPDGKIVAGGGFASFNSNSSKYIARLNADGTLDTTFTTNIGTGFDFDVYTVALQPDGKIVAGGKINSFDTLTIGSGIARLLVSTPVTLNLKAILGGDYNKGIIRMNVTLKNLNLVPATQPYSVSPFSYSGSETISGAISSNVVDWVLVEIRDSSRTTVVDKKAGLMLANGTIVDAPTQSGGLVFNTLSTGTNYNIIVRHRNHLAISTATAVTATSTMNIDYTTNTNVLGSNQVLVDTGKYGMKPGNATGDTAIDSSDRTLVRNGIESYNIYVSKDLNLDGVVNARDRQIMRNASDSSDGI